MMPWPSAPFAFRLCLFQKQEGLRQGKVVIQEGDHYMYPIYLRFQPALGNISNATNRLLDRYKFLKARNDEW